MKQVFVSKIVFAVFAAAFLCFGCKKDDGGADEPKVVTSTEGVFVCNEGNFMSENASLSYYDNATKQESNDIFYHVNNVPLGSTCQSMAIYGGKGYVVVNGSGKVYVINVDDYKHLATVSGLTSPRYIGFIDSRKAYITDLYSPLISVLDLTTNTVTGTIEVGAGTEQIICYKDWAYVCSWSMNNKIYRINTRTDKVEGFVEVPIQPNSMVLDKNNKLWVLSDGSFEGSAYGHEKAALTRIDPETFRIEQTILFPDLDASPSELSINGNRDKLYYIDGSDGDAASNLGGVYEMDCEAVTLPTAPLIPENGRLFYGLGVDPVNSDIYVSDAIDYTQPGIVYRYDVSGTELDDFKAGICPGAFCFKK